MVFSSRHDGDFAGFAFVFNHKATIPQAGHARTEAGAPARIRGSPEGEIRLFRDRVELLRADGALPEARPPQADQAAMIGALVVRERVDLLHVAQKARDLRR